MQGNADVPEKAKITNIIFLGEKNALLTFFQHFYNKNIEFSNASGMYYYPYNVGEQEPAFLLRNFAAFQASLEKIQTPREFAEVDVVVIVIDVLDHDHFADFVPFLQAILEKKLYCPPFIIVSISGNKPPEISYFGLVALKNFIFNSFHPLDAHFITWNIQTGLDDGKKAIMSQLLDLIPVAEAKDADVLHVAEPLAKSTIKNEMRRLIKELQVFKFLDKNKGLVFLVEDEYRRIHTKKQIWTFIGYNRETLINHGLSPQFTKEVLDYWESMPGKLNADGSFFEDIRREHVDWFDQKRFMVPRSLASLVVEHGMDVSTAKKSLLVLKKHHDMEADLHQTVPIVEELASINEIIVIFNGQPIFYYLPNERSGIGNIDNVSMIAGMLSVLDILRNQVYACVEDDRATVEKINYGALHFTIGTGSRTRTIVHSVRELSLDLCKKLESFIASFERVCKNELDRFTGNVNVFSDKGQKIFLDVFTPLPVKYVNKDWKIKSVLATMQRDVLTSNQLKVLSAIEQLQEKHLVEETFHLEDIFNQIAKETMISISDLLLILPGELLE